MGTLYIPTCDGALLPAIAHESILTLAKFSPVAVGESSGSLLRASRFLGSEADTGKTDHSAVIRISNLTTLSLVTEEPVFTAARLPSRTLGVVTHWSGTCKDEREVGKSLDPKLRDFVKRVFVPALVKRYILAIKRERLAALSMANA